jgi:hypothetical protein
MNDTATRELIRQAEIELHVAKRQRAPSDDPIIAEHIDRAHALLVQALARLP